MVKIVSEALDAIRSAHLERAREDNDYGHVESREFAVEEAAEEFDRMIAEVERAAAEKALTDAADDLERANASPNLIELESRYAGFYSGIRSTTASNVEKLRTRAAAYRREETE